MSTALRLVRDLRVNLDALSAPTIRDRLDRIEEAISSDAKRLEPGSGLARALLVIAGSHAGGVTPADLGHALNSELVGYKAGSLGGVRLNSLKHAGLVQRAHFGWWVLTEAGRQEANRLAPSESPSTKEASDA